MKANSFRWCSGAVMAVILMLPTLGLGQENASEAAFSAALTTLKGASMAERGQAIEQLAAVRQPRVVVVLQALLEGRLFNLKADDRLVIGEAVEEGYRLIDAQSAESLGTPKPSSRYQWSKYARSKRSPPTPGVYQPRPRHRLMMVVIGRATARPVDEG